MKMKNLLSLAVTVTLLSLSQSDTMKADLDTLSSSLSGYISFPGSKEYSEGATMKNTRFNSDFKAVAYVESSEDVSKVLIFCKDHALRPTVKSGGHDYIGRSSGTDSLSINLANMKESSINKNDAEFGGVPTMTVEPGLTWLEIYEKVYYAGYVIVGGSAHTVSPGGYTAGGGHSPLSPKLGLSVDNTLAFTLVTADGSIIEATATGGTILRPGAGSPVALTDTELFWAVRGGGGGTFGVVTSYTYKVHLHPAGGFAYLYLNFPIKHDTKGNVGERVLKVWNNYMLNELTENWSGYVILNSERKDRYTGSVGFSLLHWGGWASGKSMIEKLENIEPASRLTILRYNVTNFYDYEKTPKDRTGYRTYITNRFVQEDDLRSTKLINVLTGITKLSEGPAGCTITLLGGKAGVSYKLKDADNSAVTPKFHSAYGSFSCGVGWGDCRDDLTIGWYRTFGDTLYTIGDGVYFNEPDFNLDNWKVEYWGNMARYNRLLAVKQRYDPDNIFWCHHCVGSDLVSNPPSPDPETCPWPPSSGSSLQPATFAHSLLLALLGVIMGSAFWG